MELFGDECLSDYSADPLQLVIVFNGVTCDLTVGREWIFSVLIHFKNFVEFAFWAMSKKLLPRLAQ